MNKRFIVRGDIPKDPALIIKDQIILTPGEYYGVNLSDQELQELVNFTDWNNPYNISLIYGHRTNTNTKWVGNPSPEDWVGSYTKPQFKSVGVRKSGLYTDISIYDQNLAAKLAYGKVRCGVSAAIDLRNKTFKNLSVVDNPKCKDAFLNLSDEEYQLIEMEPNFLNLSEDKKEEEKEEEKEDTQIDERGLNKKEMDEKVFEEKLVNMDKKFEKVESILTELSEKFNTMEDKPKEEVKTEKETKEDKQEKPEEDKPKEEPTKTDEPVVIEQKPKEDDSKMVDAINKMGDKFEEAVKKVNSQTVAPTNPNANNESFRDDEKVTEDLVEQYKQLHPDLKENE